MTSEQEIFTRRETEFKKRFLPTYVVERLVTSQQTFWRRTNPPAGIWQDSIPYLAEEGGRGVAERKKAHV